MRARQQQQAAKRQRLEKEARERAALRAARLAAGLDVEPEPEPAPEPDPEPELPPQLHLQLQQHYQPVRPLRWTDPILSTKRKRGAKGVACSSGSDASALLAWWSAALRCENASVLLCLVAASKAAATLAAGDTLRKQAGGTGVDSNAIIRSIAAENAVRSAARLSEEFVGSAVPNKPRAMRWSWRGRDHVGFARTVQDHYNLTIHAAELAPASVQPAASTGMKVAWSLASTALSPRSNEALGLPGVMERLNQARAASRVGGKRNELLAERIKEVALGQVDQPMTSSASGITRSTISMRMRLRVHASQLAAGRVLHAELAGLPRGAAGGAGSSTDGDGGAPFLESDSTGFRRGAAPAPPCGPRMEPFVSPASRLAFGIAIGEELRTWMLGKVRKGDPLKVCLGVASAAELAKDTPAIITSEPPPLLAMTDFEMEVLPPADGRLPVPGPDETAMVDVGVAVHVCGEAATRVPEVLRALRAELPPVAFARQARAVILAASSQASYIGNVGSVISAGCSNAAIASSKKIAVADVHRLPLLSAFDVYAAGLANIEPCLVDTPYSTTMGPTIDSGVTPPGLVAYNLRSDKRQHQPP